MLRVGRSRDLIGVLGHVVRVATTVPQLERLREDLHATRPAVLAAGGKATATGLRARLGRIVRG